MILYAWCLMTNHIHMIISSDGKNKQEDIIRDFKKYTAKKCLELIEHNNSESRRNWMLWIFQAAGKKNSNNKNYQFWRQDNLTGARLQRVPFIILFFVQLLILLSFYIIYHSPFFISFARVAHTREWD